MESGATIYRSVATKAVAGIDIILAKSIYPKSISNVVVVSQILIFSS